MGGAVINPVQVGQEHPHKGVVKVFGDDKLLYSASDAGWNGSRRWSR